MVVRMRRENNNQTEEEFIFLGHNPIDHIWNEGIARVCSNCGCWIGSQDGSNPCGDRLGHKLEYINPKPYWKYKGRILY